MTAIIKQTNQSSITGNFTPEQINLIKDTVARGATDLELQLFLYQCARIGLDPLAKQIYFQKRKEKMVIITGIDGYRLIADRTGQYVGNEDPIFDNEDNPKKATVTVYKLIGNIRCPFTASARWNQYYPGEDLGFMWRKMPHLMLGKCAEALALRKAFPAELSGIYIKEEMEQAGPPDNMEQAEIIEAKPEPQKKPEPEPKPAPRKPSVYTGTPEQQRIVQRILQQYNVPEHRWDEVHDLLLNRPSTDLKPLLIELGFEESSE